MFKLCTDGIRYQLGRILSVVSINLATLCLKKLYRGYFGISPPPPAIKEFLKARSFGAELFVTSFDHYFKQQLIQSSWLLNLRNLTVILCQFMAIPEVHRPRIVSLLNYNCHDIDNS